MVAGRLQQQGGLPFSPLTVLVFGLSHVPTCCVRFRHHHRFLSHSFVSLRVDIAHGRVLSHELLLFYSFSRHFFPIPSFISFLLFFILHIIPLLFSSPSFFPSSPLVLQYSKSSLLYHPSSPLLPANEEQATFRSTSTTSTNN